MKALAAQRRHHKRLAIGGAAALILLLLLLLLFSGDRERGNGRDGLSPASASFEEEDMNYELPSDILTDSSWSVTSPPAWVEDVRGVIYNSPTVIPADTLRKLMDIDVITSIKRRRRVFSAPRFPDVNEELDTLVDMPLLLRWAREGHVTGDLAYVVSKARALLSSLRATLADTLDDRVEQRFTEGTVKDRNAFADVARFVVLELAETTPHPSTPGVDAEGKGMPASLPAAVMLPLLGSVRAKYGVVHGMTIGTATSAAAHAGGSRRETGAQHPHQQPREDIFWLPFLKSPSLQSALRGDTSGPQEGRTRSFHGNLTAPWCRSVLYGGPLHQQQQQQQGRLGEMDGAAAAGAASATASHFPAGMRSTGNAPISTSTPAATREGEVKAIHLSYLSGVASPFHVLRQMRVEGPTGGGDAMRQSAGRAQESGLDELFQEDRSPLTSVVSPHAVAQAVRVVRPMVDIQVISSFDRLYSRMADAARLSSPAAAADTNAHEGGDDVQEGRARTLETPSATPWLLHAHALAGSHGRFAGSQEAFEAFLLLLLANAREATYLELPNLFACPHTHGETTKHGEAVVDAPLSEGPFNLTQRMRTWYVEPLLAGRTTREKSAVGAYNPHFRIGKGPQARPESKNRRVTSMAGLVEAIAASYGVFLDPALVLEEPTVAFCDPHAPAAVPRSSATAPRVMVRFARDRLQRTAVRRRPLLRERLDCPSVPA